MSNLHNHAAERALLSLLESVSTTSVGDALAMLDGNPVEAGHFAKPLHAALYEAAVALVRAGEPVSALALTTNLRGREGATPATVVEALTSSALVPGQWPTHAREVRGLSLRRRLLRQAQEAQAAALNPDIAPEEAALTASASMASLAAAGEESLKSMQEDVAAVIDDVEDVSKGTREVCFRTGVSIWDELIGGLFPGKLHTIGAQPGVGKSALVGRFIINLAERGVKVGLFSLEDLARWLPKRGIARASGVPVKVLSTQRLNELQRERFEEGVHSAFAWAANVVRDERSGLTARQVAATARQMVVRHGCRVIFVDHLGELDVQAGEHQRHDLAVHEAVKLLRDVGKDMNVPVVLVAHFHRPKGTDGEPRFQRPTSGMWANSGGVEKMARVAVGLWLQQGVPDEIVCSVLKQNEGSKDFDFTVKLHQPSGLVESEGGRKREDEKGHHEEAPPPRRREPLLTSAEREGRPGDAETWRERFGGEAP